MRIFNKKAKFNYKLLEKYEAGIVLTGAEVKAIKKGKIDLSRSYAKVIGNEVYIINAIIDTENKDQSPSRTRKLLLNKREILTINAKIKAKSLTFVPTKVYTRKRLIKLELALAKPKRKFEKRQTIKKRDIEREIEKDLAQKQ